MTSTSRRRKKMTHMDDVKGLGSGQTMRLCVWVWEFKKKKKGGGSTKSVPKFISTPFIAFVTCILKTG